MTLTSRIVSSLVRKSPRPHIFLAILILFFTGTLTLSLIPIDEDTDYSSAIYETSAEFLKHLYSSTAEQPPASGIGGVSANVQLIPHFHAEGFFPPSVCTIHNLPKRSASERLKVIDAIILDSPGNVEDLLLLRMEETFPYAVDKYFILEFGTTRDGTRKRDLIQPKKNEKFKEYWKSIEYRFIPSEPMPGSHTDLLEMRQRLLDKLIASHIHELRPEKIVMVLTSTAEQIIRISTIRLLRNCKFPSTGMKKGWLSFTQKYLYSFEFTQTQTPLTPPNAYVRFWKGGGSTIPPSINSEAIPNRKDEWLLPDAGWQCDHCYRNVKDYISPIEEPPSIAEHNNMMDTRDSESGNPTTPPEGSSWKDRFNWSARASLKGAHSRISSVEEDIQKKLCTGQRIAGFEPSSSGQILKQASATAIIRSLLDQWTDYRFLLPGGCVREVPLTEKKE